MNKSIDEKTVFERFNELDRKPLRFSVNGRYFTLSKFYNCFKLKDKNKQLVMRISPNSTIEEVLNTLRGLLK